MNHKKVLKTFIFCFSFFQSFSQSYLKGLTKDENDSTLPYVSFFCKNTFVGMSNELGEFSFQIADSLKFDTIKCKYLGYHSISKPVNEFSFSNTNLLVFKKSSFSLATVFVKSKKQYVFGTTKILGAKRNKAKGKYYMGSGDMVGTHFKNNLKKVAFINNAYFYITNEGFPDTKFRVRIYEADSLGMPLKELLDSNYFGQATSTGNEWVAVSLKDANIKFPPFGVIVAMEWLPLAKDKVTKMKYGNSEHVYEGQCLGGTFEFKYINSYHNTKNGSELRKDLPIEGVMKTTDGIIIPNFKMLNYKNPMIRLALDVVK
jgi:hypothetical protein